MYFKLLLGRLLGAWFLLHSTQDFHRIVASGPVEDPHTWLRETIRAPLRQTAAHEHFLIGTAVNSGAFVRERPYRYFVQREFNLLVAENAMKWAYMQPTRGSFRFAFADKMVDFAEQYGMAVRGHTLVWEGQLPAWVEEGDWQPGELQEIMLQHISTVVGHFKGRIRYWDVVNEAVSSLFSPLRDSLWTRAIGPDFIAKAFVAAHQADPDAKLFYNDFLAEDMGLKSDRVYSLVKGMIEEGIPIHGVGLQGHTFINLPESAALKANLRRLGALGLEVHLTEVEVAIPAPQTGEKRIQQAIIYRRLLDACLSVPACTAFTVWGFTDRYSWLSQSRSYTEPLLWDDQYEAKLAWFALAHRLQQGRVGIGVAVTESSAELRPVY